MIRIPFEHLPGMCDTTPYHTMRDGWLILTEDTHQLHVDIEGTRYYFGDIIQCNNLPTSDIDNNKFYFDKSTDSLYRNINNEWVNLFNQSAIDAIQTGQDRIQTGKDVISADASAKAAKESEEAAIAAAQSVLTSVEQITGNTNDINNLKETLINGVLFENSTLYLTSNGRIITDGVTIVNDSSGNTNNAVILLRNTNDWVSSSIVKNNECKLNMTWSSIENGLSIGSGTLYVYVNEAIRITKSVKQGDLVVDISNILVNGENSVKVKVVDIYGNYRVINYNVMVMELKIKSTFDSSIPYTGTVSYTYIPVGYVEKTVHFILDGNELNSEIINSSGNQCRYNIPPQSHGNHTLEIYFTCTVNGQDVISNKLNYDIMWLVQGCDDIIITSDFNKEQIRQYEVINIEYYVYDPASYTTDVDIYVGADKVSEIIVGRGKQLFNYRVMNSGDLEITISSNKSSKKFNISVIENDIDVSAEINDLSLYLTPDGRSNNEKDPNIWSFNNINCVFKNFNFISDGWLTDDGGIPILRVSGDARLIIPYKVFINDFRLTGKTIEIEFETHSVADYDVSIISCLDNNRGFNITPQMATLSSEQSSIYTQYKEDEHVRLSFVVEKRSETKLIQCYINGILSSSNQYPDTDDFTQLNASNIVIGSNYCATDIYCIRVYDNNLNRYQLLNNWIYDTGNVDEKLDRFERNDIFDVYGNIAIDKLPTYLPYLVLKCNELPQFKGDKKTVSGDYIDNLNTDNSFSFENASFDVQGTSSQYYTRKNYKGKFKGFTLPDGTKVDKYKINENAIPTNVFTFKADVASSEGTNNVELVKLYNDICPYKSAPQLVNENIRQGVDGFPIVIFWDDGNKVTFLGKYNFNNDKSSADVFGFNDNDESWEVLNNTSDRVLFKSDDFSTDDWKNDFEARYPEDNTDTTKLQELLTWLKSTDTTQVTNEILNPPVTFGNTIYGSDTEEYRLGKFKYEFDDLFEKKDITFNYIITELFLMVDNRAKNMFLTYYNNGKWMLLPYDFDTAIGTNNEGSLVFSYNLEDIDHLETGEDIYNGQESVLWSNFRRVFYDDIKEMYQLLRSSGVLSYDIIEKRFEDHQRKWPEAIFNEDAYFKYLQPLIDDNNASYLSMLQGSKESQRKWWLYNRFRYLDSKYNAGDSKTDVITLRGYNKSDIEITPYADIYSSIKYGSYLVQQRALRGDSYVIECPLDNINDTEIYIYNASQISSIGDISNLKVGYADFTMANKLKELKIGDKSQDYINNNLTSLYFGNNTLLKTLDVRNCPKLVGVVDISGCGNIEYAYFEGTGLFGVKLPKGGYLKALHLPNTITNLSVINHSALTDLVFDSYENLTSLRIENPSEIIASNIKDMIMTMVDNTRIRVLGFKYNFTDNDEAILFMNKIESMRGLDENDNNTEEAQFSGEIHIPTIKEGSLKLYHKKYPNLIITYDTMIPNAKLSTSWLSLSGLSKSNLTSFNIPIEFKEPENYIKKWDASNDKSGDIVGYTVDTNIYIVSTKKTSIKYYNTDMNNMFSNCSSLISLDLSNFDTSNVTNMNNMFSNCSSLISLDLSNFNTSNVTTMMYMFSGCSSLISLDLSNFDTSTVTTMCGIFTNCSSLISLDLSNFDTSNVIDMMYMFASCSSLISLDLSNFDTSNVTNMTYMFYNCPSIVEYHFGNIPFKLLSAVFPKNVGSCMHIPLGTIETYKLATNWVGYADYFVEEVV